MKKGLFITVEGGEGAGKSTLIPLIHTYLTEQGMDVVATREPGGIHIAEQIRSVILDTSNTAMDGRTEALLYAAARRQHLVEKVLPALVAGKVVLCDRFVDSSLAYQGHARGLGIDEVWTINQFATELHMPDLTLYLDMTPETGLSRIAANQAREVNRFDLEKSQFHHKVREGYLHIRERFPERMVTVNAEQSVEAVFADVKQILDERVGQYRA